MNEERANDEIAAITGELVSLRRTLHASPELSGHEAETARRMTSFFQRCGADRIISDIAGHGLAAVFDSGRPGPSLGFRCELDALPIVESNSFAYRSVHEGVAHQCGHDGHMAMVAGLGLLLQRRRTERGRVVLLCQPAEETGAGGPAFTGDPAFAGLALDAVFALHNLPGLALGAVATRAGVFCCASRGVAIHLKGRTAHAATPGDGQSPARAMCRVITELERLPDAFPDDFCLVTVVGARLGEAAFGTAPGEAVVWATLRSETDAVMSRLTESVADIADKAAVEDGLTCRIGDHDVFAATVNHPDATASILQAASELDVPCREMAEPNRFSEDFGCFTAAAEGAMFCLGAGPGPRLHNENYDFPDALIPIGLRLYRRLVANRLGW